jgi:hypothetical protein
MVGVAEGDNMIDKGRAFSNWHKLQSKLGTKPFSCQILVEDLVQDLPFPAHVALIALAQRTNRSPVASFLQGSPAAHSSTSTFCFLSEGLFCCRRES